MKKGNKLLLSVLNSILPVFLAFVLGAILMLAIGEDPLEVYKIMITKSLFNAKGFLKTLHNAAPLILTGLAIAITFKAGIYNMGVEGQMLLGGFMAGIAGYMIVGLPPVLHVIVCLLIGIASGMLFALIPAILKAYFKVNEMVVTLMLNYAMIEILRFLTEGPFRDPGSGFVSTPRIADSAMFYKLWKSEITPFFFVVIVVFIIMYIVFNKSRLGYEITAIGKNNKFAEATGMNVKRKIIVIMLISGAISGLAGAGHMMSDQYIYTLGFSGLPGLGWDGMLISLLGMHSPIGVLVASIFYSALKTGSQSIAIYSGVPKEIVAVIQGLIILFLAIQFINTRTGVLTRWTKMLRTRRIDGVEEQK
jgi:simple sugar transport system permease protein